MSETATQAQIRDSRDPIINSLVPMFLGYAGDDVALARRTAVNTINCYRFQGHAELIAVVQVITFAMSAIRALGLTMTDEIPLELIARFQSNGVALGKAEQVLRKILRNPPAEQRTMAPLKPEPAPAAAAPPEPATQSEPPLPSEPAPRAEHQPRAEPSTTAPQPIFPAPSQAGPTAVPDAEAAETFAPFEAFITGKTQQMPPLPFGVRRGTGLPAAALGSEGTDLPTQAASPPSIIAREDSTFDEQDDAASMPPEHAFLAHQATSDLVVAPPQGGG